MDCFGSALAGSLASVAGKYALDGSQTKYASDAFCRFIVLPSYRALTHSEFHPINSPVRVVNEIVEGTSQYLNKGTTDHSSDAVQTCSQSSLLLVRASLIGFLLLLNAIMLNFLVKAMQKRGTVSATTIINGFSFVMSGLFGYLFFSELVPLSWWMGLVFILIGVYLVASSKDDQPDIRHHRPITPMPRHPLAPRHSSNASARSSVVSHSSSFDILSLHGSQDNLMSPHAESQAHVSYDSDDEEEFSQHQPTTFVDNVAKKTPVAPILSPSLRSPPAPLLSADRDEEASTFDTNEQAFGSLAPKVSNSKAHAKPPSAECEKVEEVIEYYKNKEQEELLEQDKLEARNERLRKEKQEQTLHRRFSIDTIDQSEVAAAKVDAANLLRSKIGDPKQQTRRRRSKEFSDPVPAAANVQNPHELYQVVEDGDVDAADS